MKLYIKNMKCVRCKLLVKTELEKIGLTDIPVKAGEIEVADDLDREKLGSLKAALSDLGLEITDDRDAILIEKIKLAILEIIDDTDEGMKMKISSTLSEKLGHNYKYLSHKFRTNTGIPILKYFIRQKTELVKELLIHEKLSLSQVAFRLHYSSVAHLSCQFKKETGETPTEFMMREESRVRLNSNG
jgi:AraC-like DNA-binding protein